MTDIHLSSRTLLSLLQWCDSLFPSGAFSHSFGLESAVQFGTVNNETELSDWIRARLHHQVFPCDLVLVRQAFEASVKHDLERIQAIDETAYAMRLAKEVREGGKMIASRLLQTAAELTPNPWTRSCQVLFTSGQLKGDPAVAFGITACGGGIPVDAACLGYVYLFISGQVSAALRLISIGQQAGQRIIHNSLTWADEALREDQETVVLNPEPMTFMPAAEIGTMQHETHTVRLFQS